MHSVKSKWRPIALLVPLAVIIAALALFLGGSGGTVGTPDRAYAGGGPVNCVSVDPPANTQWDCPIPNDNVAPANRLNITLMGTGGNLTGASLVSVVPAQGCGFATVGPGPTITDVEVTWPTKCIPTDPPAVTVTIRAKIAGGTPGLTANWTWKNVAVPPVPAVDITGVTCTDVYFDLQPVAVLGEGPGAEDFIVAKSLTRFEQLQPPVANQFHAQTITYLGQDKKDGEDPITFAQLPDDLQNIANLAIGAGIFEDQAEVLDLVGDQSPSNTDCQEKAAIGQGGPEAGELKVKYSSIGNFRDKPPYQFPPSVLDPNTNILTSDSCTFSESLGIWIRVQTESVVSNGFPDGKNFGLATLWFATSSPASAIDVDGDGNLDAATNPADCGTAFALPFHNVIVSHGRTATTDHPTDAKNVAAGIPTDGSDPGTDAGETPFVADDWDGDGCTDWDELDKNFVDGRDPFNPNDCDNNLTGSFNATVTVTPVLKCLGGLPQPECIGQADGTVIPGNYFTCILAQQHDKVANTVSGAIQCMADLPGLTSGPGTPLVPGPGSAVFSRANGLAGADVPPYTVSHGTPDGSVITYTGTFNPVTKELVSNICFPDVGQLLGPHLVAQNVINTATNKGVVNIFTGQTLTDCLAGAPQGPPNEALSGLVVVLAEQSDDFDHDKDGCSDMEELIAAKRPKGCGDDPLNPNDSDGNLDAVVSIQVTVSPEDKCKAELPAPACTGQPDGTPVKGSYFYCQGSLDHNKGTGALGGNVFCYTDSTVVEINNLNTPGIFGDGSAGTRPPLPYGDVDLTQTSISGQVTGNTATITACFETVNNALGGGGTAPNEADRLSVYTEVTITNIHTGVGTADIWVLQPATCPAAAHAGAPLFPAVLFEMAVQGSNKDNDGNPLPSSQHFDFDQDGCSDTNELNDSGVDPEKFGGLRDPFNAYDLFDPNGDRSIAFADFLDVLRHFNTNDAQPGATPKGTPLTDSSTVTPAGIYSPRYDRGGAITGGNPWNEDFPNGAIGFPDFLSLLRQFGHSCGANI